jgi:CRP-like cAMP-binding protein
MKGVPKPLKAPTVDKQPPSQPNTLTNDKRFTAMPVKDVLRIRMKDLEISNVDMQRALGYARPNVVAMMRRGSMKLPESKVVVVADLLQIDRIHLLGKVIAENNPELWDAISTVMGDRLVSANEMSLVRLVRAILEGHDVDLPAFPEFTSLLTPALQKLADHHNALARAALERIDV